MLQQPVLCTLILIHGKKLFVHRQNNSLYRGDKEKGDQETLVWGSLPRVIIYVSSSKTSRQVGLVL